MRVETYSKQNGWDFSSFVEKFLTDNLPMPRNATWNILSMPVLGSDRSGVILMVSVSDVRNVDWEPKDHETVVGSCDWF